MSPRFLLIWFSCLGLAAAVSRAQLGRVDDSRCSFDGLPIESAGRVDLFEQDQRIASFCGVECALAWPARAQTAASRRFLVHEERHGTALDPGAAFFVRSLPAARAARAVWRAFADPLSAAEYARSFGAVAVPNPFAELR